jgi:hypothetical protein
MLRGNADQEIGGFLAMLKERMQAMSAVTHTLAEARRSKIQPKELAGSSPGTMYVVFILRESYS